MRLSETIRLNLGAGDIPLAGYTPIDRKFGQEVYPLAVDDESVDDIRASHVLEHFSHTATFDVVKNWVDKLKPGGRIRIAVPDLKFIAEQYLAGVPINVQGYAMGGHTDNNDTHGALFDREALTELMMACGLERISTWESEIRDCASLPVSLNLQGFKPSGPQTKIENTTAILSAPRFGPVMHFACAFRAFTQLGIPYQVGQGAYWHQVLSELIESTIEAGNEFVLTIDYDSVFTAADVLELFRIMKARPEIDAICPVQMKRGDDAALFGIVDADGKPKTDVYQAMFDQTTIPIRTGHFGLTLIRTAALQRLARPWFMPKPSDSGRWGEGKVDADIQFWRAWHEAGNTLHMANKVTLGHLQEVVTWPDRSFKSVYQNVNDYHKHGIPKEVAR